MSFQHFVSASCGAQICKCGAQATHKVGEEIPSDEPPPYRHNFTAYVCCTHFKQIFGSAVFCPTQER